MLAAALKHAEDSLGVRPDGHRAQLERHRSTSRQWPESIVSLRCSENRGLLEPAGEGAFDQGPVGEVVLFVPTRRLVAKSQSPRISCSLVCLRPAAMDSGGDRSTRRTITEHFPLDRECSCFATHLSFADGPQFVDFGRHGLDFALGAATPSTSPRPRASREVSLPARPGAPNSRMRMLTMLAPISVFEPPLKRLILLFGEGRVEVLDGDVRRRDQH
jgi:hypothetical protein